MWEIGSGGWIRTSDQLINSQLRYHCATPEQKLKTRILYQITAPYARGDKRKSFRSRCLSLNLNI